MAGTRNYSLTVFSYVAESLNFTTSHTISSLKKKKLKNPFLLQFFFKKLKYMKHIPQVVPWKLGLILLLLCGRAYL